MDQNLQAVIILLCSAATGVVTSAVVQAIKRYAPWVAKLDWGALGMAGTVSGIFTLIGHIIWPSVFPLHAWLAAWGASGLAHATAVRLPANRRARRGEIERRRGG